MRLMDEAFAEVNNGLLRKRFDFDEANDIVKIDGVKFAIEVFDAITGTQPGVKFSFERRGDQVFVTKHTDLAINMVLHCPACGLQHIDAPGADVDANGPCYDHHWDNPPHRSHLCHGCGHIWRPADVPTNGVAAVKTHGRADSVIVKR